MKRRDFIINSALALGGTALLAGCGKKKEIKTSEKQVIKRKFANLEIPLIALGCMRLPMRDGKIDMVELDKMVEYSMNHGANYFDTAYMYVEGKSENAIGEILKKYPRESFILADKCPAYLVNSPADVRKLFEEQLKKCQVEYFDNYMVHNINKNTIGNYRDNDMYGELLKLKNEGKVKHIGFSFHGDPDMLREVISEHKWDFCQLQINYLDWEVINAKELYEIADEAKVPIIVMEPLRGGGLCNLPEKAAAKLKEACPDDTQASFGLRWVTSKKRVFTILSGMSNFQQLKENIDTFTNFREFTEAEEKTAAEVAKIIQSQGAINCTACRYCMEVCPRGINIPAIFGLYNVYKSNGNGFMFGVNYMALKENERADKCINCHLCSKNCPQGLDIPALLKKVDAEAKKETAKK
ncbi:aldo/keto reductase [Spirochaetes bacterium]|uniref:Aldo/keto reductase n=1 Tax=Candidatus Scatousia excrementipullorum TaxID=2840936 RepID=A0A9D9DLS2_9BACT|nr:aldo/keto reductase [Candidatus Scatousia excrementipullorum]